MSLTFDERPIMVIGSERSGTTLVMAILGCHPRLAVPEVAWRIDFQLAAERTSKKRIR